VEVFDELFRIELQGKPTAADTMMIANDASSREFIAVPFGNAVSIH
jgi:hypothetical protein